MSNLEKYTQSFRMKYESFLTGCDAMEELGLWDKENLGEMEGYYVNDMVSVIIRLIATDGRITDKEVTYLNETFGFEYTVEELIAVYENCQEDLGRAFDENFENGIARMRRINEKLADAYKVLLALICQIIIESDGVIAAVEILEAMHLQDLWED